MARWDNIVQDVVENLGDEGIRDVNRDRIVAEADKVQVDIARDALAIQSGTTINTIAAQSDYAIDALWYRIAQIFKPSAWKHDIEIVWDKQRWKQIVNNAQFPATQPFAATVWNKSLILWPAPADVQTFTIWFYSRPTAAAALGADPDLEEQWDDCLNYGITARMFRKQLARHKEFQGIYTLYDGLFKAELSKQSSKELKRMVLGPHKVAHSSDNLGF
jgi:hypothetical protein